MIISNHCCDKCQSKNIILNGKNKSGSQTYKCKDCGCCCVLISVKKTIDVQVLNNTYQERKSTPSTGRILGISHVTVWNYLKKTPKI